MFLLIELNEFNSDFLQENASKYNLKFILKLLDYNHYTTISDEENERYGLDPWVQWVSIHTGLAAKVHKINHLGETSLLDGLQIWEKLGLMGYSTGIWGPMNSRHGNPLNNKFYFPDPWSFNESASPKKLNKFLSLPRYYAKNYESLQIRKLFIKTFIFLLSILTELKITQIIKIIYFSIMIFLFNGLKNSSLFLIYDYINSFYFLIYSKKYDPDFKLIFLNSLAHFQHHNWILDNTRKSRNSNKICMIILDKILSNIMFTCNNETIILLTNAFTQKNSGHENKYLYRQIDPSSFLQSLNIKFLKLEQGMTNDGLIYFESDIELRECETILSKVTINNEKAFQVEKITKENLALFYQFIIWDDLSNDTLIKLDNNQFLFYDYFVKVTKRTGKHVPNGDIYINSKLNNIPIKNYDIFNIITNFYKGK